MAAALMLPILVGCDLHKDGDDCVSNPGMTTGVPTVCSQPPPPQFSQLGQ